MMSKIFTPAIRGKRLLEPTAATATAARSVRLSLAATRGKPPSCNHYDLVDDAS